MDSVLSIVVKFFKTSSMLLRRSSRIPTVLHLEVGARNSDVRQKEQEAQPLGLVGEVSQEFDVINPLSRGIVAAINTISFTIRTLRLLAATADLWTRLKLDRESLEARNM